MSFWRQNASTVLSLIWHRFKKCPIIGYGKFVVILKQETAIIYAWNIHGSEIIFADITVVYIFVSHINNVAYLHHLTSYILWLIEGIHYAKFYYAYADNSIGQRLGVCVNNRSIVPYSKHSLSGNVVDFTVFKYLLLICLQKLTWYLFCLLPPM